jgi:hypothetical protein
MLWSPNVSALRHVEHDAHGKRILTERAGEGRGGEHGRQPTSGDLKHAQRPRRAHAKSRQSYPW